MAEVLIEDIINSKVTCNDLHTDYNAEIVALNLLKRHRDIDQVFIKRVGSNERPFSKDIKSIQEEYDELDERNVVIETHREGLYDYLPEGLFYPPSLGDIGIEIEAIRNRIQQQRQVERDARKLFQPFEMESSYVSLNGLQAEGKYTITEESNMLVQAVSELWPLIDLLDKHTAKTFVYLLPFFHSSRGNKGWFEKCMGAFLQVPVKVTFVPNHINDLSDSLVLSQMQLGVSSMLSGSHFDGERNWAIHYGPIPYQRLSDYVPGSKLRKLLQALYDYCLPATVKVEEAFITEKQVSSFSLVDDGNNNLLGYSTFL